MEQHTLSLEGQPVVPTAAAATPATAATAPVPEAGALPPPAERRRTRVPGMPLWPVYAIAAVAGIVLLRWGENFFVPLLLGIMLAYMLWPLVDWLDHRRLPRAVSAAAALIAVAGLVAGIGYSVADDVRGFVADLPQAAQRLRLSLREMRTPGPGVVQQMRETAQELDRAAAETTGGASAAAKAGASAAGAGTAPVSASLFAWAGANLQKVIMGIAQAAVIFLLAFFILASGDLFRRKMIEIAGPTLGEKKDSLRLLSDVKSQISGYLFYTALTNALVGLAIAAAFLALDVSRPALWGLAAFLLRFIPYAGTSVLIAAAAIAALLQSGSYGHVLAIGGAAAVIEAVLGFGVGLWTQGKVAQANPTAIFLGMLFFGWLWGPWGVFLGAPLIGVGRLVCERIPSLRTVAVLLSR
jgi:predicted PurR-regulated permease PerM